MSRIIKMGAATAMDCLEQAGETNPGAIITGTAYGCLEDTITFLEQMVLRQEEALPPTAFIQSTHNTVGAQIALLLKCHSYNNTFVHRGFSFESALLDALLLLREGEAETVLVGSADELTDTSFAILKRFGLYKREAVSTDLLYDELTKGTIAGEGSAFFVLSDRSSSGDCAVLDAMTTFYKPRNTLETQDHILKFMSAASLDMSGIDLVLLGKNGDIGDDSVYEEMQLAVFHNKAHACFKHLCGEYPTAMSFAMWMAVKILQTGIVPPITGHTGAPGEKCKRILIYNHYQQTHHSLMLLSAV